MQPDTPYALFSHDAVAQEAKHEVSVLWNIMCTAASVRIVRNDNRTKEIETLYHKEEPIAHALTRENTTMQAHPRRLSEAIVRLGRALESEGLCTLAAHHPRARVAGAYVISAAPWAFSATATSRYRRRSARPLSPRRRAQVTKDAQDSAHAQLRRMRSADTVPVRRVVAQLRTGTLANGYETQATPQMRVCEYEQSVSVTSMTKDACDTLARVHERAFGPLPLHVFSNGVLGYMLARALLWHEHNILVVASHRQVIEVGIVECGILRHLSFAYRAQLPSEAPYAHLFKRLSRTHLLPQVVLPLYTPCLSYADVALSLSHLEGMRVLPPVPDYYLVRLLSTYHTSYLGSVAEV